MSREQRRRETCLLVLFLFLTLIFTGLLITVPFFAVLFGLFAGLFFIFLILPQDRVPPDLNRIRRDINRRAHFPAGGYGKGVVSFEDGGPTPYQKEDKDY